MRLQRCQVTSRGVLMLELPMPPQSNNQYIPVPHFHTGGRVTARKVKSRELQSYQFDMQNYRLGNLKQFKLCVEVLEDIITKQGKLLRIDRYFGFAHENVITKKHLPKKLDVSNRIKAFDDALSDLIGIDDKYIWKGTEEKAVIRPQSKEQAAVMISAYLPRAFEVCIDEIVSG